MKLVVFASAKTRGGFSPLFRKKLTVKRVKPLAFEFRGDEAHCIRKRVTGRFPTQISRSLLKPPAKISADFADVDSPLSVFVNQAASNKRKAEGGLRVSGFGPDFSHSDSSSKSDWNFFLVKTALDRR